MCCTPFCQTLTIPALRATAGLRFGPGGALGTPPAGWLAAVDLLPDGGLSVADDGRGIPVEEHPDEKKSNLEVVMTIVGAGGKFDNKAYKSSAGLHGMGAKAVTALSDAVYNKSALPARERECIRMRIAQINDCPI